MGGRRLEGEYGGWKEEEEGGEEGGEKEKERREEWDESEDKQANMRTCCACVHGCTM